MPMDCHGGSLHWTWSGSARTRGVDVQWGECAACLAKVRTAPHIPRTTQSSGNDHAMCAVVRSLPTGGDRLTQGVQAERSSRFAPAVHLKGTLMNRLIYIIGAIVVIVAVLSFFGLR